MDVLKAGPINDGSARISIIYLSIHYLFIYLSTYPSIIVVPGVNLA